MNPHLLQNLINNAGDAIFVADREGCVQYWNEESSRLLGYSCDEICGKHLRSVVADWDHPGDRVVESEATCKDGTRIWIERSIGKVEIDGDSWSIHILRNAEVRRRRMEELEREANTDSVSGLCNRREFQRLLESNLGQPLTLAIVDIDSFKEINDQFGHWVGDEAIQFVAKNLTDLFPTAISIARLGGDEFGVLIKYESESVALASFEDFQKQSAARAPEAHLKAIPKVSIGVAFSTKPGVSARELLTLADRLMYKSKSAGRNQTSIATL